MPTTYHQLGRVVVSFQQVESLLSEIVLLLAGGDEEIARIFVLELSYAQRVRVASTLFTRFVDLRHGLPQNSKSDFYALVNFLEKLGQRRNELVHSRYANWFPLGGGEGLLRTKQRKSPKGPATEETEEELRFESFEQDLKQIAHALMLLENVRLNVIDWLYPDEV
jgi:hypothetical protein